MYEAVSTTLYLVEYSEGSAGPLTAVVETSLLDEGGGHVYVCTGSQCNCLVGIIVGSSGNYEINCNCSSCVLERHSVP